MKYEPGTHLGKRNSRMFSVNGPEMSILTVNLLLAPLVASTLNVIPESKSKPPILESIVLGFLQPC